MFTLLMVFLGQCVFALIVIFVLKKLLDKELLNSAFEKFESCKASSEIKEIVVKTFAKLSDEHKAQLESIRKRKFTQAQLNYQEDPALKGGITITIGDQALDFSLTSRLKNFWS